MNVRANITYARSRMLCAWFDLIQICATCALRRNHVVRYHLTEPHVKPYLFLVVSIYSCKTEFFAGQIFQ